MLYFRTLGGLSLDNEGNPCSGAAGQRAPLAMLAFIAIHENGVTRDRIAAMFWPESDADRAHGSLKQALYSLRRDAGTQDLLTGTTSLKLNPQIVTCDAVEFTRAVSLSEYEKAVEAYAGDFLDGLHLPANDEFERWLERERSLLRTAHASALETLATRADSSRQPREAVKWWHRLAVNDPLSARVARGYMRALAASGDQNAAVAFGEVHLRMIAAELNATPDGQTAKLISDIRNGRIGQVDESAHTTVASGSPLIGQVEQAAQQPHATSNVRSRPRFAVFAVIVLAAVLLAGYWSSRASGPVLRPNLAAVAVLPCRSLSEDDSLTHIGDRWTEDLINKLVRVGELRPKPFISVNRYGADGRTAGQIARELNAGSLVRCSVGEWPDRIRLTVQVIDPTNDEVFWSRDYDQRAGADEINAVQSAAALDIAHILKTDVTASALSDIERPMTRDSAALRLYRMGRHLMNEGSPGAVSKSIEYFRAALKRDSSMAFAWVGLADAIGFVGAANARPAREYQPEIERYLRKALSIDERNAEAHSLLALFYSDFAFDSVSAAEHHRRALELNPNSVYAHLWKGFDYFAWEQQDSALREYQRALDLDPMQPWARMHIARLYVFSGQYDRATPILNETGELFPNQPPIAYLRAVSLIGRGMKDSAVKVLSRSPRNGYIGYLYGIAGRPDIVRHILDSLLAEANGESVDPTHVAMLQMGLGNKEEAILWLQRAYAERTQDLRYVLGAELAFRSIRKDPRFQELRRKVGFHRP